MPALQVLSARSWRNILVLLALLGWQAMTVPFAAAQNPTNSAINMAVWQQLYGVPADSAMDSNGMMHSDEAAAGLAPGKGIRFQVSTFSTSGSNSLLTFASVIGKYYTVQGEASLQPGSWSNVPSVFLIGDGTTRTMTVASSFGPYFRVLVQDNSSANDNVSDWAKAMMSYAPGTLIGNQSSYTAASLAAELATENVVTVAVTDGSTTQPPDAVTPASDLAVLTFNRTGNQLFSAITVPILKAGTAVEGTDFAVLPSTVTFPAGVNSVALTITPLYHAGQNSSTTLTVTAQGGGGYTLGAVASGSVTIYPATLGGAANGTGLTGAYYNGSNVLYSNGQTFGATVSATATYAFTQTTSTQGSIVVTYTGAPESPCAVGNLVLLSFTSGLLNTTSYNGTANVFSNNLTTSTSPYTITPYSPYTISAVSAPGVFPATFTVPISTDGISLPANTSGNVTVQPFAGATHANNFGGTAVNYNYTKVTATSGTAIISYPGTPAVALTGGGSATLQFTSGNLFTSVNGLFDGAYTVSAPSGPAIFSGATITIGSNATVTTLTPHGFVAGTPITFTTTGALPTGITASTTTTSTTYYVIATNLTATTFRFATTLGGSAVTTSGTQSGTQTVESASFTVAITAPPGDAALPASGTGAGNLTPFNAPAVTRVDPTVDYFWGTGQPASGNSQLQIQSNQNWGARWDSWLVPPADTYHFQVQATDGARVYVNNVLVIDAWALGSSSAAPVTSDTLFPSGIALTGAPVPIRVEFYHLNAPTASINLQWKGTLAPYTSYGGIPASLTFLTNGGSTNGWTGRYWTNVGANTASPQNISSGVSISIASPAVVTTSAPHGCVAGTPVIFSTTGALPTGLTAGATYYVLAANLTSTQFEVSAVPGGTAVATSGTQSGTPSVQPFTTFYGQPRYGDYPNAITNLAWSSQPSTGLPSSSASAFSIRWDGYVMPTKSSSVSITTLNPAVVTWTGNTLSNGSTVVFSSTGYLPAALTPGTTYYVINLSGNTFQVSATSGGSAISTLGQTQSGTQTADATGITDNYTFEAQASDGVQVYLDQAQTGTLTSIINGTVADSSANSPGLDSATQSLTTGQLYHIRVEYDQTENATVTPNGFLNIRWKNTTTITSMVPLPAANLFRADSFSSAGTITPGLFANYYNNATLTDPPLYSTQDTSVFGSTLTYNTSVPGSGNLGSGGTNDWAGRFSGYLKAPSSPASGPYIFQLASLSAGHLVLNGTEIIPFTAGTAVSAPITLTANQVVPILVEFYDNNSNGQTTLSWETASAPTTFVTVPAANLFQDAGATIPGVVGTYWANTAFNGAPFFADYQTQIAYTGHTAEPADSWGTITAFSAYWDGYFPATTAGNYNFSLQAQSKARIIVNGTYVNGVYQTGTGTTVVDGWTTPDSTAAGPVMGTIALPGGPTGTRVPIHIDFETLAGDPSAFLGVMWQPPAGASLTTIPNTALFVDATSTLQGVTATYFANRTQTAPFLYQTVENNNPEWGTSTLTSVPPNATIYGIGTPDPSIAGSAFTVRWTGQVLPQYSELYWFEVNSDDGARLWVNGQLILNKWQSQSTTKNVSTPIYLTAGVFYDIKLEYLDVSGNAESHLYWYSADQSEQIIPKSRLYPAITGVANAGPSGVTSPVTDTYNLGQTGSPYSYTISGSNGATFSAPNGLPPGLSLNATTGVISGTPSAPGNYQFVITTTTAAGASSQVVDLLVTAAVGTITRELYTLTTGNVAELQDKITAGVGPYQPADTLLTTLEDNTTTYAANTGERLRGYIIPPDTGNYYFWIAANGSASGSNNNAELWVSDTNQPTSNIRRATVTGTTNNAARTWNAQSNQQSFWLSLTGGTKYYFEVLHNTGSSPGSNNLSVGWYLDPTGNTVNPIANGAGPAANENAAGVVPTFVLSPWDNPPAVVTSGTVYLASLAGANSSIKGSGGAYISLNGTTGTVHVSSSGLTSGILTQGIYFISNGGVINPSATFDLRNIDKSYPNLKTADGGYTWAMQGSDVTNLQSGNLILVIGTVNNPITSNPHGELSGKFGAATGSPTPPALPSYTFPTWTENDTDPAAASRFLTQATYGPGETDIQYITGMTAAGVSTGSPHTYRQWIENQFTIPSTHHVPYTLERLAASPINPYPEPLTANAWWQNSIMAPDQLRQRIAFAMSEIMVCSTNGPLIQNDRLVSDYYDTLLDFAFTDFRTMLKQVSLTPAMGLYLNMEGNGKGSFVTGLHANENYGREIMQLFSIGLYRRWADESLVLDNTGNPIPTYVQADITGVSQALTGWYYGQPLSNGRLPTAGPATNYLDPMVLISQNHELGAKNLPDNVVLPAAVVLSQSDTSHDPSPNPITVTSTDPVLGSGFTVQTAITSAYDVYALNDFEQALNVIMSNGSAPSYVCRQLIQRLVTSNPTTDYVKRVVRAFNGQQNIDGATTGVIGDMKDTIRAILLDPEARSATEAAAAGFGKQREPVLRVTGPVRPFLAAPIPNCTYQQFGGEVMHITTPNASPHGLVSDTVFVDSWADLSGGLPVPSPTSSTVKDVTPSYTYTYNAVSQIGTVTVNAPGYKAGQNVNILFTTGGLVVSPLNAVINLPVATASSGVLTGSFTISLAKATYPNIPTTSTSGNALTPNDFNFYMLGYTGITGYTVGGTGNQTVTIPTNITPISGCPFTVNQKVYLQFTTGGLSPQAGNGFLVVDGVYKIATVGVSSFTVTLAATPALTTSGNAIMPFLSGGYTVTTIGDKSTIALNTGTTDVPLLAGDPIWINFSTTAGDFNAPIGPVSQQYSVASIPPNYGGYPIPNQFGITSGIVLTAGTPNTSTAYAAYPLTVNELNRHGTCTLEYGQSAMGNTVAVIDQAPLYSTTVFNYFYPDYKFPGTIASLGMTTPEFQLTDATDTMNLTNNISSGVLSPTPNANGLMFFTFNGTTNAVCLDLRPFLTLAYTQNLAAVQSLVSTLGNVLTGGNLSASTQTTISNYVANTSNFANPTGSTDITHMSARVRAVIHLIVTSTEYAIQK